MYIYNNIFLELSSASLSLSLPNKMSKSKLYTQAAYNNKVGGKYMGLHVAFTKDPYQLKKIHSGLTSFIPVSQQVREVWKQVSGILPIITCFQTNLIDQLLYTLRIIIILTIHYS